jgi:hypothetical protein
MAGEAQYRDLWICSAFQSGDRWGVRHHRVRKSGDFWCNERGHYVTCTDTGIGHADTREAAVRSYLAYLQKLCDESRLWRNRPDARAGGLARLSARPTARGAVVGAGDGAGVEG